MCVCVFRSLRARLFLRPVQRDHKRDPRSQHPGRWRRINEADTGRSTSKGLIKIPHKAGFF
jgi:hypothetical protein